MFSLEFFLIVLAIVLTSILFCVSVSAIVIFRCYDPKETHLQDIPASILARTRQSLNWARSSVFCHHAGGTIIEDSEGQRFIAEGGSYRPRTSVAV